MIVTEQVTDKLQELPTSAQEEVLHFVEFLAKKFEKPSNNLKDKGLTPQEKVDAIERWAKKHSFETPVILDDSREIIYED